MVETVSFFLWHKKEPVKSKLTFKTDDTNAFLSLSTNDVTLINKAIKLNDEFQKQIVNNILDLVEELNEEYYNAQKKENYEEFQRKSKILLQKLNNL
jgi:hypothetical protein